LQFLWRIVKSTLNQNLFPVEKKNLKIIGISLSGKKFGYIKIPTIFRGKIGKRIKLTVGSAILKFTKCALFPRWNFLGEISLDSGVRYDPVSRNLYLPPYGKEIKFQEESLLQKLPDGIKKAIGDIVAQTIAKKPIYNLQQSTIISGFVTGN